ncbi:MAG TPA: complex I NDUFA9 subunit family protein [Xanthobacteraceae bacterium]|jgi:NADH dehydrogenase|nr:complex I NDUFA9 subunit family protein [Xanthobacteraceae bacterium]
MERSVTVFGGTGFLGRRIVRHLLDRGFAVRVAARHPERARPMLKNETRPIAAIPADVNDDGAVAAAVAGAYAVVNAVSLYVEHGSDTFHSVHVEAAARVARHAREHGVERLAHVSGIGADAASASRYIRSRGQGEDAVRGAFPGVTIVRPAVMFGPDDEFLTPIMNLLRRFPAFPMFGRGRTRLQPVHVDDVADAVARVLEAPERAPIYELGGPRVYSYEALLRAVAARLGVRRALVPVPFELWRALSIAAEMLPHPPLTLNQVELMEIDTVASPGRPGLSDLGIVPRAIETVTSDQ